MIRADLCLLRWTYFHSPLLTVRKCISERGYFALFHYIFSDIIIVDTILTSHFLVSYRALPVQKRFVSEFAIAVLHYRTVRSPIVSCLPSASIKTQSIGGKD